MKLWKCANLRALKVIDYKAYQDIKNKKNF